MKKLIPSLIVAIGFIGGATAQVPTNGLIAYYPFRGSGVDSSTNKNNIALNLQFGYTNNRFGITNGAITILSTSSYAQSSKLLGIKGNTSRTVSFWVNDSQPTLPFGNGQNANGFNCVLFQYGPTQLANPTNNGSFSQFQLRSDCSGWTGNGIVISSGYADVYSLPPGNTNNPFYNQWNQITYVYNGALSNTLIYFNGQLQSSQYGWLNKTNTLNTVDAKLSIGASGNPGSLLGASISDLRIFNRALSPSEVQSLYNQDITLPTNPPLVCTTIVFKDFDAILQPGVWHGYSLDWTDKNCSYQYKITPDPTATNGNRIENSTIQSEWNGQNWVDVFRVAIPVENPSYKVHVRIFKTFPSSQ